MAAPFYVGMSAFGPSRWGLWMRRPYRFIGWFDTQIEAIDHAHTNWPWWP